MDQSTAIALRRHGRPDQHESAALFANLLATATRLFKEQGYAATSIEQIANEAGSGKQTVYRRFGGKEALFQAVMDARVASVAERVLKSAVNEEPLQALRDTTREMFEHMMNPESIAFHRVLIAEASRFPELVARTIDHTIGPFRSLTVDLLCAATSRGQLKSADPHRLFGMLTGLLTGWPHQQALLGRNVLPTRSQQYQYFDEAWTLFLAGASPMAQGPAEAGAR